MNTDSAVSPGESVADDLRAAARLARNKAGDAVNGGAVRRFTELANRLDGLANEAIVVLHPGQHVVERRGLQRDERYIDDHFRTPRRAARGMAQRWAVVASGPEVER